MIGFDDLRVVVGAPLVAALAVLLAPARAGRALAVAGALGTCALAALAAEGGAGPAELPWAVRGIGLRLAADPLALVGVVACAIAGALAVLEEPRAGRGRLAGLLALHGAALAGLLAGDVVVLAGAWALVPALTLGLVAGTGAPAGRVAGRALALGLAVAAGAVLVAAAGLVVAHHAASGGTWAAGLAELAAIRVPAAAALPIAGALALAAALAVGLAPLHAWMAEGTAETTRGAARLVAGPVRWLGLDLLVRVWAPLVPVGAAALAPGLAALAVVAALVVGIVAWSERAPRRRAALLGLVPWALAVAGAATLAHEGLVGALILGVAGALGPTTERPGRLVAAIAGLATALGGSLVVLAALRFSDLTLGAAGPWCAAGAALTLVLALSLDRGGHARKDMFAGAGPEGQVLADRAEGAGALAWWAGIVGAAALLALTARPGVLLGRLAGVGEAWVEAIAWQRCLALREPRAVPVRLPQERSGRCEAPLAELRAALVEARGGQANAGGGGG